MSFGPASHCTISICSFETHKKVVISPFDRENIGGKAQAVNHNGPVDVKNAVFDLFSGVGRGLGDHDTAFENTGLDVFGGIESGAELPGGLNGKTFFL